LDQFDQIATELRRDDFGEFLFTIIIQYLLLKYH
jgi:hypothetical protein